MAEGSIRKAHKESCLYQIKENSEKTGRLHLNGKEKWNIRIHAQLHIIISIFLQPRDFSVDYLIFRRNSQSRFLLHGFTSLHSNIVLDATTYVPVWYKYALHCCCAVLYIPYVWMVLILIQCFHLKKNKNYIKTFFHSSSISVGALNKTIMKMKIIPTKW